MELISLGAVQMELVGETSKCRVGETSRCREDPQLTPLTLAAQRCGACLQKKCTSGRYGYLAIYRDELARQRARELANTKEFGKAQRQRKESRSPVSGTQASDWSASLLPAEIEVREGAVHL